MARSSRHGSSSPLASARSLGNAGTAWAQTAAHAGEMAVAAAQTIAYRTAMLLQAASDPVKLSHPEFALMGREKVEAGNAAAWALAESLNPIYEAWFAWANTQAAGTMQAMLALARCRTPMDALAVQQQWLQTSLSGTAASAAKLVEAGSRIMGAGLAPIHEAATANARRLGRRHF